PQEVTHAIYDVMGADPSLWNESDDFGEPLPEMVSTGRRRMKRAATNKTEAGNKALLIARQLYGRLIAWGWLEEEEYGLRVTVDMSMGPLLVIQRLASLNKDVSQRFGGLIVTIRLNLEAVEKLNPQVVDRKQREVALALREARNQADQFTKSLRAILSDLKRIRRSVMESKTVGDRLEAFFEEFVDQLLLKDFESILTFNHPYRFRDAIVDLARRIAHAPATMQVLSEEYVAASISASMTDAVFDVEADLLAIESTFGQIGEMFERIESFRRQLEARVRNTIKYAERGTHEDRAIVVTTLNTLFDRYKEMVQPNGSSSISLTRFREILKEASRRSLVDIGDFDSEAQDFEVAIRPMIKLISGSDALQRIERFVRSQEVGIPLDGGEDT
ncbi:MAG TPA: Wadjet anti-phage system protein JetA family protein, partial [Blastocatellia bacterium]|nr:Wadjet anti-phage system protein JetA family protein [Blastocatellia bacterium]